MEESKLKQWCDAYARDHGYTITYKRTSFNSGYELEWKCANGHTWKASANQIKRKEPGKHICRLC